MQVTVPTDLMLYYDKSWPYSCLVLLPKHMNVILCGVDRVLSWNLLIVQANYFRMRHGSCMVSLSVVSLYIFSNPWLHGIDSDSLGILPTPNTKARHLYAFSVIIYQALIPILPFSQSCIILAFSPLF